MPGEIDNSDIKSYILYRREERGIVSSQIQNDDDIELIKGNEYFEFSPSLWKFFFDLYGAKPII